MRSQRLKFLFDRSVMKSTLLGEESTFLFVSWLPIEEFSWYVIHTYITNTVKYGRAWSIMKVTLLGEQSTLCVSMHPLEEIPWIIILTTFRACCINIVSLVAIGQ